MKKSIQTKLRNAGFHYDKTRKTYGIRLGRDIIIFKDLIDKAINPTYIIKRHIQEAQKQLNAYLDDKIKNLDGN